MVRTQVIKDKEIEGVRVQVHACPWRLYRTLASATEADQQLEAMEKIAVECAEVEAGVDILDCLSRKGIEEIFRIATADDPENF